MPMPIDCVYEYVVCVCEGAPLLPELVVVVCSWHLPR